MTLMRVRLIGISELPLKQEGLGPSHFPVAISLRLVLRNSTRHPDIFRKRQFFSSSHWCATPVRCLEEQLFAMWRSWQSYDCQSFRTLVNKTLPRKVLESHPCQNPGFRTRKGWILSYNMCAANFVPPRMGQKLPIVRSRVWILCRVQNAIICHHRWTHGQQHCTNYASTLHPNVPPFCHCKSWTQIFLWDNLNWNSLMKLQVCLPAPSTALLALCSGCSTDSLILN